MQVRRTKAAVDSGVAEQAPRIRELVEQRVAEKIAALVNSQEKKIAERAEAEIRQRVEARARGHIDVIGERPHATVSEEAAPPKVSTDGEMELARDGACAGEKCLHSETGATLANLSSDAKTRSSNDGRAMLNGHGTTWSNTTDCDGPGPHEDVATPTVANNHPVPESKGEHGMPAAAHDGTGVLRSDESRRAVRERLGHQIEARPANKGLETSPDPSMGHRSMEAAAEAPSAWVHTAHVSVDAMDTSRQTHASHATPVGADGMLCSEEKWNRALAQAAHEASDEAVMQATTAGRSKSMPEEASSEHVIRGKVCRLSLLVGVHDREISTLCTSTRPEKCVI